MTACAADFVKIRARGSRRQVVRFEEGIDCFSPKDGNKQGSQMMSRISDLPKSQVRENNHIFGFIRNFPQIFKMHFPTSKYMRGQLSMKKCTNIQADILKMADFCHFECQEGKFYTLSQVIWAFLPFSFLSDVDGSKRVLGSFFAFFLKIDPKNTHISHHTSTKSTF